MTIDCVLLSLMVSDIPSRGVELDSEEMKFKRRSVWIATFDVTIPISGDKKFTVPALMCDHAGGRTFDTWLGLGIPDNLHSSGMIHEKISLNGLMFSLSSYSQRRRSLLSL